MADWLDAQLDVGQRLALVSNSRANGRAAWARRGWRFAAVECSALLAGAAAAPVLRRPHIAPEHAAYLGDQPPTATPPTCGWTLSPSAGATPAWTACALPAGADPDSPGRTIQPVAAAPDARHGRPATNTAVLLTKGPAMPYVNKITREGASAEQKPR